MKRRTLIHKLGPGFTLVLLTLFSLVIVTFWGTSPATASPSAPFKVNLVQPPKGGTIAIVDPKPNYLYDVGDSVKLLATPANEAWLFAGWSTEPPGLIAEEHIRNLDPPAFLVEVETTITALFVRCYSLSTDVTPELSGDITVSIKESTDGDPALCSAPEYANGSVLTLTAIPALGYDFNAWGGDTAGSEVSTELIMSGNKTVSASFVLGCRTLVTTSSEGGKDPVANPTKSSGCSTGQYNGGTAINFTAEPDEGWRVGEWLGATVDPTNSLEATKDMPFLKSGENHTVAVTYVEKPILQFESEEYTVNEDVSGGQKQITVIRTGNDDEPATVPYVISNGTAKLNKDYDPPTSGIVEFAAGESVKSFVVNIRDDDVAEGTETINLMLEEPTTDAYLGSRDTAILRILDNEGEPTLQFDTANYLVPELDSSFPVTVTLSPPSATVVLVTVESADQTATAEEDYRKIAGTDLVFRSGDTSKTINVKILPDMISETEETFKLVLVEDSNFNAAIGDPSEAIITIEDNDELPDAQFSEDEYYAKVGEDSAEIDVTLSKASGQQVTVGYSVIPPGSAARSTGELIFDPGVTTRTIPVNISGASHKDQYFLQLSNIENALPGFPINVSLYVLNTGPEDCHRLVLAHTGSGLPPTTTNLNRSLGCQDGQFVAGELISVMAQPALGWFLVRWHGTVNDNALEKENVVQMPDNKHTTRVDYETRSFFSMIKRSDYFLSIVEEEPNNIFAQANGPLQPGKDYFGGFPDQSDSEDRYYFLLEKTASVQMNLSNIPLGRDYDLLVYDQNWDRGHIAQSTNFYNQPEEIDMTLQPGKYYLRILPGGSQPSSLKYKLRVTVN